MGLFELSFTVGKPAADSHYKAFPAAESRNQFREANPHYDAEYQKESVTCWLPRARRHHLRPIRDSAAPHPTHLIEFPDRPTLLSLP